MSGRLLLDTNIIIAFFAKDPEIHKLISEAPEVFIPCIALGELYFGARKSSKPRENLALIDELAGGGAVLSCDETTAKQYGAIKNRLKEKGRPIPENDIWIAAIAAQHNLTLVSRDTHFEGISELKVKAC